MKELRFHGNCIVTGRGSLDYLENIKDKRVFIVTGESSVFANGVYQRAERILKEAGSATRLFSRVSKNPSIEVVEDGLAVMRDFGPDTVIGLGGGSAIDASKAMALFYDYPEIDVENACLGDIPQQRRKTGLIAIPTTSGTAAEVTRTAVLTFPKQKLKIGVKTPAFIPDIAILDADVTMSMPPQLVAATGVDALSHAVECFLHPALDDFTEQMAAGAIEGLFRYLPVSYHGDSGAREKVHNYQCLAGCAFANVGTIMNHGLAHALGGMYDLGHGQLIALGLPYVLAYNVADKSVKEKLGYLARRVEKPCFISAVQELNDRLKMPTALRELGITEKIFKQDIPLLISNTLKGSTRNNPRPVSPEAVEKILGAMYYGDLDAVMALDCS